MRILRTFAGYSALEKRLVLNAWVILGAVRMLLWVVPYRWVERWCMKPPAATVGPVRPADIARAVTRAATLVPAATCLTQALAGGYLIRRSGRDAVIHFGVARETAGFKAHAWLESDGVVLIGGREADAYLPLIQARDARH